MDCGVLPSFCRTAAWRVACASAPAQTANAQPKVGKASSEAKSIATLWTVTHTYSVPLLVRLTVAISARPLHDAEAASNLRKKATSTRLQVFGEGGGDVRMKENTREGQEKVNVIHRQKTIRTSGACISLWISCCFHQSRQRFLKRNVSSSPGYRNAPTAATAALGAAAAACGGSVKGKG